MAFNDVTEPLAQLQDPAVRTEEILGQPFSNPGSVLDWTSPTHVVNEFIVQVTGYDMFGEAAKAFSGDWEQVWQAAGAYRNLANAMQDIGINVAHGNIELDASWDGNAADAAYAYFADLSAAISLQQLALNALADDYENAAEGTYRIADTIANLMEDALDAALVGAVGAAAGTATIETGIGFVTGWGVAAYEAYKITEIADKAKKLIALATTIIGTAVGGIQASSASTGALSKYPLRGVGYTHPGSA
jgi:multisubunit Na+/H+ antiporter MnhB subunit